MNRIFFLHIGFLFVTMWTTVQSYQAVTIVPVADLVGEPHYATVSWHRTLPICWAQHPKVCPRMHQILYNEIVTVLEEQNDKVLVKVSNLFFSTPSGKKCSYWTLKKNLMALQVIKKNGYPLINIPRPRSFDKEDSKAEVQTVVLIWPFTDQKTAITFSAGTRFVAAEESVDTKSITVYAFDPTKLQQRLLHIPKELCVIEKKRSKKESLELFLQIVRSWTRENDGFIPYVWGGSSFTYVCKENSFNKTNEGAYERKDSKGDPHSGFDCSGLISRAAQIAGIPFYFKNSHTIINYLQPLKVNDRLENGDIISYRGHVLLVSDTKQNKIIEAVGYTLGHGKVQELPLNDVFKHITTFDQLEKIYFAQHPITRLHKDKRTDGEKNFDHIILLKLNSIWNQ
jgi:hypothetical protein